MSQDDTVSTLIKGSLALERGGEYAAALQQARQAYDLAKNRGEQAVIAAALVNVARMRFRLGQYDPARELANEALSLTEKAPHTTAPARVDALIMLASCAAETNSLDEADDYYRRAADLAREFNLPLLRIRALHNLSANVYMPRGQFDLALAADQEAYRMAKESDWREWLYFPLVTIAWACQLTCQRPRARAALDELKQASPPGSVGEAYHYYLSACLAQDEGDIEPVPGWLACARSIAESSGDPGLNVEVRLEMSRYWRTTGDAANARTWADDALTFAQRVGYQHKRGQALIERGRAAWALHDLEAAEADFRAALALMDSLQLNFDAARAALFLAALLHQQKHPTAPAAWRETVERLTRGGFAFLADQERTLTLPLLAAHLTNPDPALANTSQSLLDHLLRVPPAPLKVSTLGGLHVRVGGRLVDRSALRPRKAGELLALLCLAPENCLSIDQVLEALWPGREPGLALPLFHQATSTLRRALEPELPEKFPSRYLSAREGEISLRLPEGSQVDYEGFEAHCKHKDWDAALAAYHRDYLPEYLYADWAATHRQRLAYLHQQALLARAEEQMRDGQPLLALEACRRVLAADPWQEQAVLLGMGACLEIGDRSGARRLYRTLEKTLREELNAEPQTELQELFHSLGSAHSPKSTQRRL